MTSINYVKQTGHFVCGLIILLFCLPCPVAAYADGENELAWIRTTEDQEQFYYRWADFADKRYWNNEKLLATFDNPLLEKIVASNCKAFLSTYLIYDNTYEPPLLTTAMGKELHGFISELDKCRRKFPRDLASKGEKVTSVANSALLAYSKKALSPADEQPLQEQFDMLVRLGATVSTRDEQQHTGLYYAARNGNLPLVNLYLAYGAEPLSVAELAELANSGDQDLVSTLKKQRAEAEKIAALPYSAQQMIASLEAFENDPTIYDSLPLKARGKIVYLMVDVDIDIWTKLLNPDHKARRKELILHIFEGLISYQQRNQLLSYKFPADDSGLLPYARCDALRDENNRFVAFLTELVGFFNNTWNEDVVHRHQKALEQLEGFNQCRLQSTEFSGGPG